MINTAAAAEANGDEKVDEANPTTNQEANA